MAAHDFQVVEDGSVGLHGLANAVFECFKGDAEVEAMLHEGFAGGIVADVLVVIDTQFLRDALDVTGDDVLEGVV